MSVSDAGAAASTPAESAPIPVASESQAVGGASATDDIDSTSKPVELENMNAEAPEKPSSHAPLNRSETAELALGPDGASAPPTDSSLPTLRINLMLTTGARHAYTISQKYLTSRKVEAVDAEGNFDPREMSGYKLKELIWTDWRSEWEPRPRDPGAIRLIIMGRMIDDKSVIKGEKQHPFDDIAGELRADICDIKISHSTSTSRT